MKAAISHDPFQPNLGRGPEGARESMHLYTTAFPDSKIAIEREIAEGDYVVPVSSTTAWSSRRGRSTRTFTATDAAGNATSSAQTITVFDNTPPTIAAPPNASAFTGAGAISCNAVISDAALGAAIASDNSGTATVTRLPAGNTFAVGTTTLTYTATDPFGNTASATQLVTVTDNTVPTISIVPAIASYQLLGDVPAANANDATANDNCGVATRSVFDGDNGGAAQRRAHWSSRAPSPRTTPQRTPRAPLRPSQSSQRRRRLHLRRRPRRRRP